ncbi:hypothetical protein JCM5353_002271, partial [Sporobolomyces roseus]
MVSHRAAIRAAAVFKRVQQLNPPSSSSSPSSTPSPSRRTTPSTQPHPSQWLQQRSPTPSIEPKSDLLLPKPPFIEIMDPAVFSHPSLAGDLQVYRFQQPIDVKPSPLKRKWDRRTESFEKLELFGKSLLRLTLTELVTNHHASLSVPAVETLVDRLLSRSHILLLSSHYSLSTRLLSDALSNKYLKLSPSVHASLFYSYVAGIYHQEGVTYSHQWIRQCFKGILNEEYENLKMELFPEKFKEESNNMGKEKLGLRNQNPVIPGELPLDQLDTYLKQLGEGQEEQKVEWNYAVKGIAPNQSFMARLKIGERIVEGGGKTKHWAKQSAAAAFLGIKDVDPLLISRSLSTSQEPSYTSHLYDLTRSLSLPKPIFRTTLLSHPYYSCTLEIGTKFFSAKGLGKVQVRKEASRLALEYFQPEKWGLEDRLLGVRVRTNEKGLGEVVGRGLSKSGARSNAVLRTMEMLGLDTGAAGQSEEGKEEEIKRIEKEK